MSTTNSHTGTPDTMPRPQGKPLPFDQLTTFQQAIDYALSGYHVSNERAEGTGPKARLWRDAADAYRTAYLTMLPLQSLPADKSFPQAKELLKKANHMADQAAAAGSA
jgi:hypothetical protein